MISPEQCRMARGLLNWTVRDLARATEFAPNTVHAFEMGRAVRGSSIVKIEQVLGKQGVDFTSDGGVRAKEKA